MLCKVDTILIFFGFFYFYSFIFFFSFARLRGLQATVHTARTVSRTISSEQQFEIGHESLQRDSVASQTRPNTNHSTCCSSLILPSAY